MADIVKINFILNGLLIGIPMLVFLIDLFLKKIGKKGIWKEDENENINKK
jgi:hypothetical protein